MSQLAQLSEAELEERNHITGRRAIALTLEGQARAGERTDSQAQAEAQ